MHSSMSVYSSPLRESGHTRVLTGAIRPYNRIFSWFRLCPRTHNARFRPESPVTAEARPPSPKSSTHCSPGCWPGVELHAQPVTLTGPTRWRPFPSAGPPNSLWSSSISGSRQSLWPPKVSALKYRAAWAALAPIPLSAAVHVSRVAGSSQIPASACRPRAVCGRPLAASRKTTTKQRIPYCNEAVVTGAFSFSRRSIFDVNSSFSSLLNTPLAGAAKPA